MVLGAAQAGYPMNIESKVVTATGHRTNLIEGFESLSFLTAVN